ncbi:hypothetical protein K435DRAFT_860840 [Dendrothele bispora CBS 962.96]|uniref:Ricin B lectin domain-containing protein n=1 Tax=Dendrothele bispora (strain CBS 962.96) TaxID=1314807 RepID=A0A4S8LY24_DENBC|nr:hypothetical protein K435DRAFT_860840 [Dendrothele bispora CBS 962.96]
MSIPDGEYYIFDKFNDCVTANKVANGVPVLTHFAQTDDQQWQLISGEGVAQIIQNVGSKTYIGSLDKDPILSTSPLPWYINETGDTDWYQISRGSNRGSPFWVGNGQGSAQQNESLTLSSGGFYSFFFLPVSHVNGNSPSNTVLSSLVKTTPSSSGPTGTVPVSASPSTANLNSGSSNAKPTPIGAIVGGTIGGFMLVVLMIFCVWLSRRQLWAHSKRLPRGAQPLTAFTLQAPTAYSTISEKASTSSTQRTQSPPPYDEVGK